MNGVTERAVLRIAGIEDTAHVDLVSVEEPLEIRVSGEPIAITMRTPGDDSQLALGFLFSEGIIRSIDDVGSVAHCGRPEDEGFGNIIEVSAAPGVSLDVEKVHASRRGTLTTSACGVCGRRSVDDLIALCGLLPSGDRIELSILATATERLSTTQRNFVQTGGTHAAAAFDHRGRLLAAFEDVGRHNAVDKVVGELLMKRWVARNRNAAASPAELESAPAVLAVSGRASFEIVQKATVARIPVVASVSAASSLAIDLASRSGMTLAGFVRSGGLTVYTHPERIRRPGAEPA